MRTLPHRSVVIVGGGLAAGLVARQLTAQGKQVVVLEQGGDRAGGPEGRIPTQRDELRWSVRLGLMQDAATETYAWRHSRREESAPLRRLQAFLPGTGVGGAGNHWNGQAFRWEEYDSTLRTRLEARYGKRAIPADLPIQDWGVTYAELEPYYDQFEKLFGVSGQAGNLRGKLIAGGNPFEGPRSDHFPQGPMEQTEGAIIFAETAANRFGYKPFPGPSANSRGSYTNPDGMKLGACQFCGHCDRFICEAQAKATPAVLLYPLLQKRPSFELRPFCRVQRVSYDAAGKVARGVDYLDLVTGEAWHQPADVVVLAAFTMTNTRLLLLSGIGQPYDPVSRSGSVGRNFCYQLDSGIPILMKDRWINPFMSAGASGMIVDEFNDDNFDHSGLGFFGGGFISSSVAGRPIAQRRVPAGTPRWGTAWKQANADWYNHSFALGIQGTCYPHPENFMDLDPDYTDAFGQPLLRITFDVQENDRRAGAFATAKAWEVARAMDATLIGPVASPRSPYDLRGYQNSHVTGGTPLGTDPATSAVSPRLQHWNASNLFVVGASVFPHDGGHHPTAPVAALALRLGDDLLRYLAKPAWL
jgi:gluconate 2-dehydrogenase alpha chain